jgi:hypothetical protein
MRRTKLSTTVDDELLRRARRALPSRTDAALLDEALAALLRQQRLAQEIDASYVIYERHPLAESDAWGDLESFREVASAS